MMIPAGVRPIRHHKTHMEIEKSVRELFAFEEGEAWGDVGDIEALKAAYIEDNRFKK